MWWGNYQNTLVHESDSENILWQNLNSEPIVLVIAFGKRVLIRPVGMADLGAIPKHWRKRSIRKVVLLPYPEINFRLNKRSFRAHCSPRGHEKPPSHEDYSSKRLKLVRVHYKLLGHSTITHTLNTYSHIINPINKVASDQMDDMFKV